VTAVPVLVITGPVGVGKTRVMEEVSDRLGAAGVPHAFVDMDAMRSAYPAPPGDRFNTRLGFRNLAAAWENYRAVGSERLVLADVVESRADLDGYREAVPGAAVTLVRLRASVPTLQARVAGREIGSGREWHLARAAELAAQMDRDALEDLLVETDGRTVGEVAREVLARSGWPGG
jgi:hypothetical protein